MTYQFLNKKLSLRQRQVLGALSMVIAINTLHAPVAMAADSQYVTTTDEVVSSTTAQAPFVGFVIPIETEKPLPKGVSRTLSVDMTAYTSSVEECDGNPFITADGSVVRDGIVATNILPFGTKVRIPAFFGDKVFTVHDRMNARYAYRMDIWMSDKQAMIDWGIKHNVKIEIVELGNGAKNWDQWIGRTADYLRIGKYGPGPTDIVS